MARDFYQKLLTVLIGLAVGSLAASAVFHLIPQAYGLIQEGDHSYLYFFSSHLGRYLDVFMIERILKIVFHCSKDNTKQIELKIATIVDKTFVKPYLYVYYSCFNYIYKRVNQMVRYIYDLPGLHLSIPNLATLSDKLDYPTNPYRL
ncbi:hypothetical protein Avbf_15884 [Armadillidium vulgare]|nr:hypothetical protein Avbf_15884 [Armadillidium vulgare]